MRFFDKTLDGSVTPLSWLLERLKTAASCRVMTGYLNQAGVNLLASSLREMLDRGGQLHLVVDHREGEPTAADLRWLIEWLSPYGERATLTLWRDELRLHSKAFLIDDESGARHAMIGSANLTYSGLTRNHESFIWVEPHDDSSLFVRLATAIEQARQHPRAFMLDLGTVASLAGAIDSSTVGVGSVVLVDLLQAMLDEVEALGAGREPMGLATGFTDLDRLLSGLQPGQLILIAGRPGVGKSLLALDFARNVSIRNSLPVLFFSFEMTTLELVLRLNSAEARVPLNVLRSGQLSDDEWTKLAKRMGQIAEAPLHFNSSTIASVRHIAAEARRMCSQYGIQLLVIDHIQLLSYDRRTGNRQEEVSGISRALKRLAMELQIPIIAVSQLNREPEARGDKRPQLRDLRDSGGLEQDADVVILLHREDYYDKESPRAGEADLIVAKHRNGPTDTITVAAQLHLSRFVDMAIG